MRGGIAERGGVRVGHRIIEINSQSVVATPHEKIVHILSNAVGEVRHHSEHKHFSTECLFFRVISSSVAMQRKQHQMSSNWLSARTLVINSNSSYMTPSGACQCIICKQLNTASWPPSVENSLDVFEMKVQNKLSSVIFYEKERKEWTACLESAEPKFKKKKSHRQGWEE